MAAASLNVLQKLAWVYAVVFLGVVSLGYVPGFTDAEGALFGLFTIELKDDALHLASAIWAALAAWHSARASMFYFKVFGTIYALDGLLGLIAGQGFLDGGIFLHGPLPLDVLTKLMTNLPHIIIGGSAMLIGFVLSRTDALDT